MLNNPTQKTIAKSLFTLGSMYLLRYVLGLAVGHLVLPAQTMFRKDKIQPRKYYHNSVLGSFELNYFGVTMASGIVLDTLEIRSESNNLNQPYIIKFCGNGMSYHQNREELLSVALQNNATVIGFDYPNVGKSTATHVNSQTVLVNAGIAQVQRLLELGVNPKNITLHGLSLGGAVATLVAAHFHQQKPPQRLQIINDRSFSKVADVVAGFIGPNSLDKPLQLVLYVLNWNMNAAHAYKQIPDTHKMLIVSKDDSVIKYRPASLYQAIKPDLKQQYGADIEGYKAITRSYKVSNGNQLYFVHGEPIAALLDKNGQSVEATINRFIAKSRL